MSATWNYAQLSKAASVGGGPEIYIAAIKRGAFVRGLRNGLGLGAVIGGGVTGAAAYGMAKYRAVQEKARAAEAALLAGLERPDSEQ